MAEIYQHNTSAHPNTEVSSITIWRAGDWTVTADIDSLTGARTADLARSQRQRGRQRLRPRFGQFVFRHHLAEFVGHPVS